MKYFGLLKRGRMFVFALALFLLFFAAASFLKIEAAGNVTGWLWGGGAESDGSTPWDGTNTNLGWISMNRSNCDADENGQSDGVPAGCPPAGTVIADYGVVIPFGDGDLSGYAWSENLGWISFEESSGFPSVSSGDSYPHRAKRIGDELYGWARIMSIPQAGGNAGGWGGWLRLHSDSDDPVTYGVNVTRLDGTGNNHMYAWSEELGWTDFNRAKMPMPINGVCKAPPNGESYCPPFNPNPPFSTAKADLCTETGTDPAVSENAGGWTWVCTGQYGGVPQNCYADKEVVVVPKCGSPNFCTGDGISEACESGTAGNYSSQDSFEVSWTCTGNCPAKSINCSAQGKKACGWIETN